VGFYATPDRRIGFGATASNCIHPSPLLPIAVESGEILTEERTMPKQPKTWVLAPKKKPAPKVPDSLKTEVEQRAHELIETALRPKHVQPPPKSPRFNYIIDLWTNSHRSYFYFGTTYASPGPTAISPTFETKFARMEFVGRGRFNLSYMRHNDKWFELFTGLTLDECLELVRDDWHFLA
jgi:hypothetical protein